MKKEILFYVSLKSFIAPELAEEYLVGVVLLGAAPCTAMVFVWSHLTKGNSAYSLVQVAVNDLILFVPFSPIVTFLLGIGGWYILLRSVVLFVVIPLRAGMLTRTFVVRNSLGNGCRVACRSAGDFDVSKDCK